MKIVTDVAAKTRACYICSCYEDCYKYHCYICRCYGVCYRCRSCEDCYKYHCYRYMGVMGIVTDVGHVRTTRDITVKDTWVLWGLLQM